MTFATDNFEAGLLIGKWAAATMGDTSGAKIAMLDINKDNISVDVARDTGFLVGFDNYLRLWNDPKFMTALTNNAIYAVISVSCFSSTRREVSVR